MIAFIASVGTNLTARRTAVAHLLFNVIGVFFCLIVLGLYRFGLADRPHGDRQIANAHTIFNVFNSIIFIIALPYFTRLSPLLFQARGELWRSGLLIWTSDAAHPAAAIGAKELLRMAVIAATWSARR